MFGGFTFNDYFALELAYIEAGTVEASFPPIFGDGSVEGEIAASTTTAVGRLPLSETFALYGKLGLASFDAEVTARYPNLAAPPHTYESVSFKESSDDLLMYGVGAAFGFGEFEVIGEYEMFDVSAGDSSVLSLTGLFRF
ncbi:MAG TPA: hypothetical protein VHK24_14615 [Steroidobacter sp.]|nr:hypothetical protein [Steroidobacter sp.]